jgi:hypothetical protein
MACASAQTVIGILPNFSVTCAPAQTVIGDGQTSPLRAPQRKQ